MKRNIVIFLFVMLTAVFVCAGASASRGNHPGTDPRHNEHARGEMSSHSMIQQNPGNGNQSWSNSQQVMPQAQSQMRDQPPAKSESSGTMKSAVHSKPESNNNLSGEKGTDSRPAKPGENGGSERSGKPGGDKPGSGSSIEYNASNVVLEDSAGSSYSSSSDSENAVLVAGHVVTITDATVNKTGSGNGDEADFYGVNAAVLAKDGATLTISGTTVVTDGGHANGIFSYGTGTTVNVSDTTITTSGNNSGGLMTTGGATLNAENLTVSTGGNSSAAIRSDRGGGTVNVTGGTYSAAGVGSPAIYSTADITVSNAVLSSAVSEAVVIEGGNSVTLNSVEITGSNSKKNGKSTVNTNVLIYQSLSGDASEGNSVFSMTGGSMTSLTGTMFHVTNVTTEINLNGVSFTYASDSNVFLDASADAWGSSGKNGGNVTLNLTDQSITGAILQDSVSSVTVNLSGISTWKLLGDSYISGFSGDMANVDLNGYTLYINGIAYN